MKIGILLCCIMAMVSACNSGGKDEPRATADKMIDVLPGVNDIDSVQIIYYDNPDGDSLRYTRYFSYSTSMDTSLFSSIVADVQLVQDTLNNIRDCRSEGKMYVFSGKPDEPVKTLYFSTRCDTCCYLYYIRNGLFYYSRISETSREKIKQLKKWAKQP